MAIDERAFINKKRASWERLSVIVERTKNVGLRGLSREELPSLGSLYRRAASDLAYARAQGANPNLVLYLNELVGNAHGVIYSEDSGGWARVQRFLVSGLPAVLRRRMAFILAALAISLIGAVVAYKLVQQNANYLDMLFPAELRDVVDGWKKGFADSGDISAGEGTAFSSFLMTNNTKVGIIAFATGITLILPVILMLQTGSMMGALIAVVQPTGHLPSLWAGILPHGVCELSAIFICAGAGFVVGWAVIAPGNRTRKDALVIAGQDAVRMMVGTVPLFIIAGIIEGNVSHSSLPHWAKFSLAAVQFLALLFYIYGTPRPSASQGDR